MEESQINETEDFFNLPAKDLVPETLPESRKEFGKFSNLDEGRIPVPVPFRVKSGEISPQRITLVTSKQSREILWEDIEFIALGIIRDEVAGGKAPQSQVRALVRHYLFGDNQKDTEIKKELRESYYLDIFILNEETPYRIDHTTVNYRGFLRNMTYNSAQNFRRLTGGIVYYSLNAKLDRCLTAYLNREKEKLIKYDGFYDFELECLKMRSKLYTQTSRSDIEIIIEEM